MAADDADEGTRVHLSAGTSMPPADQPVGSDRRTERHAEVDALVRRALPPALGLCVRVFDPLGDDAEGREKARMIAMDSIARSAASGATDDDDGIRSVIATVAEAGLDGLVGRAGSVPVPEEVDTPIPTDVTPVRSGAPGQGQLSFAVLQDATAAARRTDRRVAFVVLAAGLKPASAAVLLGIEPERVNASLERIARRIAEMRGDDPIEASDVDDLVEPLR